MVTCGQSERTGLTTVHHAVLLLGEPLHWVVHLSVHGGPSNSGGVTATVTTGSRVGLLGPRSDAWNGRHHDRFARWFATG